MFWCCFLFWLVEGGCCLFWGKRTRGRQVFYALWVSKQTCNSWKSLVEAVVGFVRIVLGEMVETCRRWWSCCVESRNRGQRVCKLTELRSEDIRRHLNFLAPYSPRPSQDFPEWSAPIKIWPGSDFSPFRFFRFLRPVLSLDPLL